MQMQIQQSQMIYKRVTFDESRNEYFPGLEYDRLPIQSALYMRCFNRLSHQDWIEIHEELNTYKYNEMIVHKDSLQNTRFH